jgi:uncharacterized protein YhhL (DUF1145 family)
MKHNACWVSKGRKQKQKQTKARIFKNFVMLFGLFKMLELRSEGKKFGV